jgi:hypothetical protein
MQPHKEAALITVEAKKVGARVIATVKVGIGTGQYTYTSNLRIKEVSRGGARIASVEAESFAEDFCHGGEYGQIGYAMAFSSTSATRKHYSR